MKMEDFLKRLIYYWEPLKRRKVRPITRSESAIIGPMTSALMSATVVSVLAKLDRPLDDGPAQNAVVAAMISYIQRVAIISAHGDKLQFVHNMSQLVECIIDNAYHLFDAFDERFAKYKQPPDEERDRAAPSREEFEREMNEKISAWVDMHSKTIN